MQEKILFEKLNLCEESIRVFGTLDIKENEAGQFGTAEYFGRNLK